MAALSSAEGARVGRQFGSLGPQVGRTTHPGSPADCVPAVRYTEAWHATCVVTSKFLPLLFPKLRALNAPRPAACDTDATTITLVRPPSTASALAKSYRPCASVSAATSVVGAAF